jgi:hypothetical protein
VKDPMWLLLVLGPLAWMALLAPFTETSGDEPALVRLLILYSKGMCLNVGTVSIVMPWLPTAWRAS